MSPIDAALLVVFAMMAMVGYYWVLRRGATLQAALAAWTKQVDPECDDPSKNPAACAPMLLGRLGPPPVIRTGPPLANAEPPAFDVPRGIYAAKLVARFIAYLGTGDVSLITMHRMTAPVLSFARREQKMAMAATWSSLDSYSAVVAIRGTKTVDDFRLDLKYHEVRPSTRQIALRRPATPRLGSERNIQVHSGMYSAYTGIRDSLFAALPTGLTTRGTGDIFIAGHSMGAAVAYYYALELAVAYPNIGIVVVGLAPPRAGDAAFAKDLSLIANCASIINLADFVPSMPWSYMPDVRPPYSADEYAHVTPIFAFNNRKADISACHSMLAYFEGVTNSVVPAFIPSL